MSAIPNTATTGSNSPHSRRIVVCGGGVIGVCTAYFLASKASTTRISITVVERSSIACAASGKAGGFLALDFCDGTPVAELARASFHLHRSLSDLLDGPRAYGYRPLTALSLPLSASDPADSRSPTLPSWIDGAAVGRPRTTGTLETTAQVHPLMFTRAVLSSATEDYGVEVVFGEVQDVEVDGTGVRLRDGRMLPADVVVIALGPWSGRLPLVSDVFHVSGRKVHSIVLRPPEPAIITPHALFLRCQNGDPEVYPRPTGEVYICGPSKEVTTPDNPEDIVGERESIAMLHEIAGSVSSHLNSGVAETAAEQACFMPCTVDGFPVIGEIPGTKNCYVATGHSCWGILNAPATGAALAELILEGRSTTVNLEPFSPTRFLKPKVLSNRMVKNKEAGITPMWDKVLEIILCDICLKEIDLGNRPTNFFTMKGWRNIGKKFYESTNRDYHRTQLKKKLDQLKKDWKIWKELKRGSTGLGWDPVKQTIDAPEEWWAERLKVVPAAKKFKICGFDHELEEKLDRMIGSIVPMGKHACAPSETGFGDTPEHLGADQSCDSTDDSSPDFLEVESTSGSKRLRVENKKKVEAAFLRSQISELVAPCSAESHTSQAVSINQAVQILNANREISEDDSLYFFAIDLLENPTRREFFIQIPDEIRAAYVRRFYNRMNI